MSKFKFGDIVKYDSGVGDWVTMLVLTPDGDARGYRAVTLAASHEQYWPVGDCDGWWNLAGDKRYTLVDRDERVR